MSNFKSQLKTAITSSIRNGAKVTELIKQSLIGEDGKSLCELATESYAKAGAKGNKFVDTLTRTIRKVTSHKDWDGTPLKMVLDKATKEYYITNHKPKVKEVDTLEQIIKLVESDDCTLTKDEFAIIGEALAKCLTPEMA
jgi:hypothetical protein